MWYRSEILILRKVSEHSYGIEDLKDLLSTELTALDDARLEAS